MEQKVGRYFSFSCKSKFQRSRRNKNLEHFVDNFFYLIFFARIAFFNDTKKKLKIWDNKNP